MASTLALVGKHNRGWLLRVRCLQGAQTAARLFVWTVLLAVHGALIVLGADAWGRAAAGAGVAGLAALGAAWATVEEQDSELVVPRSALPAGQQQ